MSNYLYERFKDSKYPDADTRSEIMRKALDPKDTYGKLTLDNPKYAYTEHPAYQFVREAVYALLKVSDAYLCRQYCLRDLAVEALNEGDIPKAIEILEKIGED